MASSKRSNSPSPPPLSPDTKKGRSDDVDPRIMDIRVVGGYLLYQSRITDGNAYTAKLVPLDLLDDREVLEIADSPVIYDQEDTLKYLTAKEWIHLQNKLQDYGWTAEELERRKEAKTWAEFPKRDFIVTPKDLREKRVVLSLLRMVIA